MASNPSAAHRSRNDVDHQKDALESLSSVDYYACCGLGHRLIRMSLANYVAKQLNFSLRSFWGWCGEKQPIEVFSYLFRPPSASEVSHVTSRNQLLPFYNEVPGFQTLVRTSTAETTNCPCREDKVGSDLELYTSLRNRFRNKGVVNEFVHNHFSNATFSIGIHVRAGNGEGGDFERKGRSISNPDLWVQQVRSLIQESILTATTNRAAPVVYLATDTPSMVNRFRQQFALINVPVFALPQQGRLEEGNGVLFGESDKVHNKGNRENGDTETIDQDDDDYSSCLRGWTDTITDMMILSHADVVIAAKPSSFVQTLPMSLAFGRPKHMQRLSNVYCEVISQFEEVLHGEDKEWIEASPTMQCYESYDDWCCNHSTWIKFHVTGRMGHKKVVSKEFVKFPPLEMNLESQFKEYKGMRNRTDNCPRPRRGRAGGGWKDKCLPHVW